MNRVTRSKNRKQFLDNTMIEVAQLNGSFSSQFVYHQQRITYFQNFNQWKSK